MSKTSVSLFLNPSVQSFPLLPRSFLGIPHLTRRYRRRSARRRIRQLASAVDMDEFPNPHSCALLVDFATLLQSTLF